MRFIKDFVSELGRRNVIKVGITYAVIGWLVIQIADITFPVLLLPDWALPLTTMLTIFGFPIALILAWAFELTPEGVQREVPAGSARPPAAGSELASIAVLPFRQLAGVDSDLLTEAIPLEINHLLARIPHLRVISSRSSALLGDKEAGPKSLSQDLDVQYVISGAVARSGERVRVMMELADTESESVLWSDTYEAQGETDLLSLPQQIAEGVVSAFGGERLKAEVRRQADKGKTDLNAWQRVHAASAYLLDYSAKNVAKAESLLQEAVELDPDYAVGQATLGVVLAEKTLNAVGSDPAADRQAAVAAIEKAEQSGPRDPVVLRAAGCVHAYVGNYRRSIALLRRTVALAPYDFGAWGYMGWPLVASGDSSDLGELQSILDRLLSTAPAHPGRAYWLFHRSVALLCAGSTEAAIDPARQAVTEQPGFAMGTMHLANALGAQGQLAEAKSVAQECVRANPAFTCVYYVDLMNVLTDQTGVVEKRTAGLRNAGLIG